MRMADVRLAIGVLQIYPIITAIAVLADTTAAICGCDLSPYLDPLAGVSLLTMVSMLVMAYAVKVSYWSMALYITMLAAMAADAVDSVFGLTDNAYTSCVMTLVIICAGILSSFFTAMYSKYRENCGRQ